MVGVEFDRLEYARDELYFWDYYVDEDEVFSSFHVRGSLTIQRIFSKGPLFQVGYLAFNHTSLQVQKWTNIQGGGGSFEIG